MDTIHVGRVRKLYHLLYAPQKIKPVPKTAYSVSPLFDAVVVVSCLVLAAIHFVA